MNGCTVPRLDVSFPIDIYINIMFSFLFLSVFFMAYVSRQMESSFNHHIRNMMEEAAVQNTPPTNTNPDPRTNLLLDRIESSFRNQSERTSVYNAWLFRSIIGVNVAIWLLFVTTWFITRFSCGQCIGYGTMLAENAVIFTVIGVVEWMFFKYVISRYVPVKPSLIVGNIYRDMSQM